MKEDHITTVKIPEHLWEPQYIFGELMRVAIPIVEAYHSDFYHDAIKVRENFNLTNTFFYYVGKCGTYLLTEHNAMYGCHGREHWFAIAKTYGG